MSLLETEQNDIFLHKYLKYKQKYNALKMKYGDEPQMAWTPNIISSFKYLKTIEIYDENIYIHDIRAFTDAINQNEKLETLIISKSNFTDDGILILAGALETRPALKNLQILKCNISDKGIIALADILVKNKNLEIFYLDNQLEVRSDNDSFKLLGLINLAEALKNSSLKTFSLINCKISPGGVSLLAEALQVNKTLTQFVLDNAIVPKMDYSQSIKAFSDALTKNNTLQTLRLNLTCINVAGMNLLAKAIKNNKNTSISELAIQTRCMDMNDKNKAVKAFSSVIKNNPNFALHIIAL